MSTFLLGKHNLADLDDVEKARDHLGLGSLALLDESELEIDGGTIKVDEFWLMSNYGDNKILKSDHQGKAYWGYVTVNNYESNISQFYNDVGYVTGIEALNPESNLSDLHDVDEALYNLGLSDFVSPLDEDGNRVFDRIKMNHLTLSNFREDEVLIVREEGQVYSTPIINDARTLIDSQIYNSETDRNTKLTSLSCMRDVYTALKIDLATNSGIIAGLEADFQSLQDPDGIGNSFLRANNNLNDLNDPTEALCNLGLHFIDAESESIRVDNLEATSITYPPSQYEEHLFLTVNNSEGVTSWSSLPNANMNLGTAGTIVINNTISDDFIPDHHLFSKLYVHTQFLSVSTTTTSLSSRITSLDARITGRLNTAISSIPTDNIILGNGCNYLKAANNLSELTNLNETYANLELKPIARTGDFYDLTNIPSHLNEDTMNEKYLQKEKKLSDFIGSYDIVRSNLGLGDLALQYANDIEVTGGVIRDLTSIRTNELILDSNVPNYDSLQNLLFMKAVDVNGTAGWGTLPKSDYQNPGLIYTINDQIERDAFTADYDYISVYSASYIDSLLSSQGSDGTTYTDGQIAGVQSQVTSNRTDIDLHKGRLDTIDGTLTSLSNQISTNDTDLATHDSRISTNTSSISNLQTQITSNDGDIIRVEGKADSNTSNINTLVEYGLDVRVRTNESALSNYGGRITTLETHRETDRAQIIENTISIGTNLTAITSVATLANSLSTIVVDGDHSLKILDLEELTNNLSSFTLSLGLSVSTNSTAINDLSVSLSTAHQELDDLGSSLTTDSLVVNNDFQFGDPLPSKYVQGITEPSENYRQVLAVNNVGKSEWISMETAMTSSSGRTVEIGTVITGSTITDNLNVSRRIQYDDGDRDPAKNIPEGSLLYSDDTAVMHWRNTVRLGQIDTEAELGFTFEKKDNVNPLIVEKKMHFFMDSVGQMIIAQEGLSIADGLSVGSGVLTTKHIFR
uniref:Uncharacterized protein n=1 Tax=viral metagenome TaxID=1070528 RepID=A0A6C0CS11_9ZZZZ